jgi:hypothetical protein
VTVTIGRWYSWIAVVGLMALTLGAAVWSASTAPTVSSHNGAAISHDAHHSFSLPTTTTTSTSTTTSPPPSRILTISSTDLSVGEQVTVTGSGCPVGHWGTPVLQSDDEPAVFNAGNGGLYDSEEYFDTSNSPANAGGTVGANGLWTMTGTVPMIPPGSATLTGWCMPQAGGDGGTIEFSYLPGLRVSVSSSYRLDVEQGTTVKAGTTLALNLLGGDCPGVSTPDVALYSASRIQLALATASAVGGWHYAVAIPPDLTPGQYVLEADCVYSRGLVEGSYAPFSVTVP